MTAARYNLTIDQGSDFEIIFTIKVKVDGVMTPMNLTDWTPFASMKKDYGSATSTDFECTVTDASAGKIKLKLGWDKTGYVSQAQQGLAPGLYKYDLEIHENHGTEDVTVPATDTEDAYTYKKVTSDSVTRLLQGDVTILPEITR